MARIREPVLAGSLWGLGLGVAAVATTILAPGIKTMAQRAVEEYREAIHRAAPLAAGARRGLQDIYGEAATAAKGNGGTR